MYNVNYNVLKFLKIILLFIEYSNNNGILIDSLED